MTSSRADTSRRAAQGHGKPQHQRADAQRNRAKILAATPVALHRNPDASVAEIAAEAGIGRMTLYGHFKTRKELIEAALVDSLERGEEVLREVPLDGDLSEAFSRLVASSWALLSQARALLLAAQKELPVARIRELHKASEARMRSLIEQGRSEHVFRTDLPVSWLLTVTHATMNAAAEEITAGRLATEDAASYIDAILRPALARAAQS